MDQREPGGNVLAELDQAQEQESTAQAMAHALAEVLQAMQTGRSALWNEAAQKLVILLSAPGASQGEHFLQVRLASS